MKRCLQRYLSLIFLFILGSHNGYIALWKDGNPEPAEIYPYRTAALPEADQDALNQGIEIENQESLLRLLEDYFS